MTKDEARRELINRWRALPIRNRQTYAQAIEFARTASDLEFETLGNRQRVIEAWLVRDLQNRDNAVRAVDAQLERTKGPTGPPSVAPRGA